MKHRSISITYRRIRIIFLRSLLRIASHTPQGNGFEVIPETGWLANDHAIEGWWNPVPSIQQASNPNLAFFGDKDPKIDPTQWGLAYRQPLEKAGNLYSKVALVPGANHGMTLAKTDCFNQQMQAAASDGYTSSREFPDTLEQWLKEMPK